LYWKTIYCVSESVQGLLSFVYICSDVGDVIIKMGRL
jgi:hypothetical protein